MEEIICSICTESVETGVKTIFCNHIYHKDCLHRWLSYNNSCPNCRHELLVNNEIQIQDFNTLESEIIINKNKNKCQYINNTKKNNNLNENLNLLNEEYYNIRRTYNNIINNRILDNNYMNNYINENIIYNNDTILITHN